MLELSALPQPELLRDSLETLEREWTALWDHCPTATPFQHPGWLLPWCRHFGADKSLRIFVLRDRGRMIALAPFCLLHEGTERKLMLLGAGVSDSLDVLILPGYELAAARAVLQSLAQLDWDICDLTPLPDGSPLLMARTPELFVSSIQPADILTSIELSESPVSLAQSLSRHFNERIAAARRRANLLGTVHYETATADSFDAVMNFLLHFHRARWGLDDGMELTIADAFYRETASVFFKREALYLRTLTIEGRVAAALYAFVQRQRAYFYLMSFDPAYARISPGVLLMVNTIDTFLREGITRFEFLRGREAFKQRWNVTERSTFTRKLHRKP